MAREIDNQKRGGKHVSLQINCEQNSHTSCKNSKLGLIVHRNSSSQIATVNHCTPSSFAKQKANCSTHPRCLSKSMQREPFNHFTKQGTSAILKQCWEVSNTCAHRSPYVFRLFVVRGSDLLVGWCYRSPEGKEFCHKENSVCVLLFKCISLTGTLSWLEVLHTSTFHF